MITFFRPALVCVIVFLATQIRRATGSRYPRRMFLRNALVGATGLVGLQMAGSTLAYAWPLKTGTFGTRIPLSRDQVPEVGAPPFRHQAGKFFLINNEEGVLALYWKCPHLGCTVPWNEEEDGFKCPCHSSEYNRYGELIRGPAPRPMDLMAIEIDEETGNLIVNSGDISERSAFSPEQATRI